MSLGDRIDFHGGSYEIRGKVDGRYVIRIRNCEKNVESYRVWTSAEREEFDRKNARRQDNLERNAQIYERNLAGETFKALGAEFDLSPSRVSQLCAQQKRKENRGKAPVKT